MRDWVSVDHQVEHETGSAEEISCGPGIDQDVAIWTTQHKGLRSRGYRGEYLPLQERRIRYLNNGSFALAMASTLLYTLETGAPYVE